MFARPLLCLFLLPGLVPGGELKLEVRLEFSAKEFDPAEPGKERLKVIVKNLGKEAVAVSSTGAKTDTPSLVLIGKGKTVVESAKEVLKVKGN